MAAPPWSSRPWYSVYLKSSVFHTFFVSSAENKIENSCPQLRTNSGKNRHSSSVAKTLIQQLEINNCCRGIHKLYSYSILVLSLDGFFSFNSCILIVVQGPPSLIGILFLFNSLHHPQRACQSFTRTKNQQIAHWTYTPQQQS